MIRYVVRLLRARGQTSRSLSLLTVFGVALGVASVLTIQILNRNAVTAFRATVQAVSPTADLTIFGRGGGVPDAVVAQALRTTGVAAAFPLVRKAVTVVAPDTVELDLVGVDLYAPTGLPLPDPDPPGAPGLGWAQPDRVTVTPALAQARGWRVGDSLRVAHGSRLTPIVVGALVDFQRVNPLASRRLALMDIGDAQARFGTDGYVDQVDVRVAADAVVDRVRTRLQSRLGDGYRIVTPVDREREATSLLSAFRLNLTALSLISVLVGVFLVYATTRNALARRRTEFGVLRSLGATPTQVLGVILAEVTLLGLLGVAVGVPVGYGAARFNVDAVSATLTNLYLLAAIDTVALSPWMFLLAGLTGVGGAWAGAWAPAWEMSRRDPISLLAPFAVHDRGRRRAPHLLATAAALVIATGLWYGLGGRAWQHAGFALAFVTVVTIPLVTPSAVAGLARVVTPRRFNWRYSVQTLGAHLQATALAIAGVAVAVSMLVGVTFMVGSFRETLSVWLTASVRADIYVGPASGRGPADGWLDPDIVARLRTTPGVAAVDRLRRLTGDIDGRPVSVVAVDFDLAPSSSRFPLLAGNPRDIESRVRAGEVLVSEPLARKFGVDRGDTVPLGTNRGPEPVTVAGVYYEYGAERGTVVMHLDRFDALFGPGDPEGVALYLEDGGDVEATVDALRATFAGRPLAIRSNRTLRRQAMDVFDQTFAITRILQAMSLLVAATGITLTLLVMARERVAELALYRALGATRRQLFGLFVGKGAGMASVGVGIGGIGGGVLAAILIFVTNRAYFGWTIQVHWPWSDLAFQAATIAGVAVLASLYPALRASRISAQELRRDDV